MAAAFAAYLRLGDAAEYIGIGHSGPKRLPQNVDGKNVAIVDFSFDADTMAELKRRANTMIVLDHHHSAMKSLQNVADTDKVGVGVGNDFQADSWVASARRRSHTVQRLIVSLRPSYTLSQVFEMKMSGCTISWDFFHGDSKEIPLLFRYIEDGDIWRWALHSAKEFSAGQFTELPVPRPGRISPKDFAPWEKVYMASPEEEIEALQNFLPTPDTIAVFLGCRLEMTEFGGSWRSET